MTDEDHARELGRRARALNNAIYDARRDGLQIEINVLDKDRVRAGIMPIVTPTIRRQIIPEEREED